MKRRFISVLCLLMVACMSFSLVACGGDDKTPDNNPQDTECTVHVDVDKNGSCDTCGATVEVPKPDVPMVDVTKDVPNAVEMFNKLKNGNLNVMLPEEMKLAIALSNATVTGEMFEELGDVSIQTIEIDGSKIHMTIAEDGEIMDVYMIVTEDGYYGVSTDGTNYEYTMEPFDTTDTSSVPDMTVDDLVYEDSTGYFVVKEAYINKLMGDMTPESNLDDTLGMEGLDAVLSEMKYDIKFKIAEDNTISELSVKGAVTQNDIRTEHLSIVYKQDASEMKLSMTINYYVNVNLTVKYIINNTKGQFVVNMTMVPPAGAGMENQSASYTVDVEHRNNVDLNIPADVQVELDKAANAFKHAAAIDAKYENKEYECDSEDCYTIAILDSEYNVYVLFDAFWGTATYSGCTVAYDESTVCFGTLQNDVITVTIHSTEEQSSMNASTKYEGVWSCNGASCETVIVYDAALGKYVVFEQDFFNEGEYEFYTVMSEPWGVYCVGTVDLSTKTITVTEHSPLESFIAYVEDRTFTPVGYNNCDTVFVYEENSEYYVMFSFYQGKLEYCGYSSMGYGCLGTIDFEAGTITVTSHQH